MLFTNKHPCRRLPAGVALCVGSAVLATAALADTTVVCPLRLLTTDVSIADPARIAGFEPIVGGMTSSQSWLQNVAVYTPTANAGAGVQGVAQGKRRIAYAFDGATEVQVACIFEGGVTLVRPVGTPMSCTADIKPSKASGGAWGMESARFSCR
ncbi:MULTISPECIES: STY0301 family protein [Methylosinus]|uniref:Uncharacterized protein n=1 Tax=Methylosinus trichosporium (strain ATCC 35070 / NCIMB 11131 / UNIQEM 75 / OB3b) TaxID=595536 RepID=A0A2D2D3P0_METT3|nr:MULTISPECIES: STY0301 family protein [Methylosinus]ATQ69618.1 hypothetical protein CQW49_18300 [Methylosinus trichosporium OB3b]OBS52015.1 hypothetical protein A8B73_13245 [Methylosinus sp. 3S-1]